MTRCWDYGQEATKLPLPVGVALHHPYLRSLKMHILGPTSEHAKKSGLEGED